MLKKKLYFVCIFKAKEAKVIVQPSELPNLNEIVNGNVSEKKNEIRKTDTKNRRNSENGVSLRLLIYVLLYCFFCDRKKMIDPEDGLDIVLYQGIGLSQDQDLGTE